MKLKEVDDHIPPHKVISRISCCAEKNSLILHPPLGQLPTGVPSADVSIELVVLETASGTFALGKNQILRNHARANEFSMTFEEPVGHRLRNSTLGKFSDKDTSATICEAFSIRSAWCCGDTTLIIIRIVVAVCRVDQSRRLNGVSLSTSSGRVETHLAGSHEVDGFHNVDFATDGPSRSLRPPTSMSNRRNSK